MPSSPAIPGCCDPSANAQSYYSHAIQFCGNANFRSFVWYMLPKILLRKAAIEPHFAIRSIPIQIRKKNLPITITI